MASLAELQDALVNADKAGDKDAARQLADAIVSMQQTQAAKPTAVQAGEAISGVPRQLGLTARYALEGPAQFAEIATEPLRKLIVNPTLSMFGASPVQSLSQGAKGLADSLGLPSPQGANERVIGDAARLVAGGGAAGMAGRAAQGAGGLVAKAGELFAANPLQNALAGAGAGLAGGSVREAGGGPGMQAAAALAGGVAAPMAGNAMAGAGRQVAGAARSLLRPETVRNEVDQAISLTLRQQGIDWAALPERIKQPMRAEAQRAMQSGGDLNPDALRRLIDFQTVGATPTRGMLTQDPVQITREMNLAKTGANSLDTGLQRLPQLQNQNTATLLRNLDELGAANAPDAFATGERVLGALNTRAARSRAVIDSLYSAARDTSGRSAPLDGAAFTSRANQVLDEQMVGGKLPADVAGHLNKIARGEVPFTVDYAEQLKTRIGQLQRASSDGQERMALGLVRRALDETPLRPAPQVNPGNLPAVPGTVPPSPAALGQESIAAFNRARSANRAFMQRVENTPALAAALDGAQPDRFVQQYIIGSGATVRDVDALRRAVASDPQAMNAVRGNIVAHLKSAATNGTEDITKFSPASYNKALANIGERKLSAFFEPEEIRRLQSVGRVGTLMTAQPAGTAVNNSNTGALLIGRAMDVLDSVAGKLPLGLDTTIQGVLRGTQQGQAMRVPPALLYPRESVPLSQILGPAAIYGGLLSAQPVQ